MIDALVVTYNRIEKLKECITNLLSMNLSHIFVVNNNSTDGTQDYLDELSNKMARLIVFNLDSNVGGAGGFNYGLKKFYEESKSEYVWVMDDDTIPTSNALDIMQHEMNEIPSALRGFVTGDVIWTDGSLAKMNVPQPWKSKVNETTQNILRLRSASFVAILISRLAIKRVGFPISDFFIWGDDVEFTQRITKSGLYGIQTKKAKIIHKMKNNNNTNIINENDNILRIKRHYYDFRNRVYISKLDGMLAFFKTIVGRFIWAAKIIFSPNKYKLLKLRILISGTLSGIKFAPIIERVTDQ
ncbi:glycosyltransferase family 2 protein [Lactiplantibacillus plantarum]|uniref:glycosyltransferase family 2 protein n=1 Tax=Lactiplantibacillus plantarum TaxID=1590 RepID=UPI001E4837FB|nr:glycosyltransferase family 2 protein [Lactiplantibacillus plantarum]MCC9316194.1 glycosyltransferase family 2 protein [Lactiplantibacillus plantarum]